MVDMSYSDHLYVATNGKDFKIGRTNNVLRRCKFRDLLISIAKSAMYEQVDGVVRSRLSPYRNLTHLPTTYRTMADSLI